MNPGTGCPVHVTFSLPPGFDTPRQGFGQGYSDGKPEDIHSSSVGSIFVENWCVETEESSSGFSYRASTPLVRLRL